VRYSRLMFQLPSPPGLPPRFIRFIVGCVALGLALLSLAWFRTSWQQRSLSELVTSANITTDVTTLSNYPPLTTEQLAPRFAYVQYATDLNYLCNSVRSRSYQLAGTIEANSRMQVINFHLLKQDGAQYDFVLIHPRSWSEGVRNPASCCLFRFLEY
jgi:alpha-N-acetylglucosamine transferase